MATKHQTPKSLGPPSPNGVGEPAAARGASIAELLDEIPFLTMLRIERKRTERSNRPFLLMLLEPWSLLKARNAQSRLEEFLRLLARTTRETDIKGWYKQDSVLAVIFTEVGVADCRTATDALLARVTDALSSTLDIEDLSAIRISFHVYPEDPAVIADRGIADLRLYPDLIANGDRRKAARWAKRTLDVVGSIIGLAVLSPLLLAIAAAVKLTSKGPVLFRQERVGLYGTRFTFLKFRSMRSDNDDTVHREYVKSFIAGFGEQKIYKLTNDSRVTSLGRFLRRASLDELPQLFNVLLGEMSLVGPRPSIPYEADAYAPWHRRRMLAVKPGITGLWQVGGRSRVKFDEMVRLDVRYAEAWSVWLDLKILCETPRAVLMGGGAF
ncbi:MAG: sugar transferase [Bryobacteraceae bacterium]